jgi:hypothetical protein
LLSPEYVAEIVLVPADRALVVHCAVPPADSETALHPEIVVLFALNATVPVGAGEFTGVTLAVKVTGCPYVDGFALEDRARVVAVPDDPTVQAEAADGMPLATTYNSQAPVGMLLGTSKFVDTIVAPVATPIVLCPCVLA